MRCFVSILGIVCVAVLSPAQVAPIPLSVDASSSRVDQINVYQANTRTIRAAFQNATIPIDLTGCNPYMLWFLSRTNNNVVTSSYSVVTNGTNGIVDFTFTSSDLNTNGLFFYEIGVTTNNQIVAMKQGRFNIIQSPTGAALPVVFAQHVLMADGSIPWEGNEDAQNWNIGNLGGIQMSVGGFISPTPDASIVQGLYMLGDYSNNFPSIFLEAKPYQGPAGINVSLGESLALRIYSNIVGSVHGAIDLYGPGIRIDAKNGAITNATYYGNGSGLTNLDLSASLPRSGGVMTGPISNGVNKVFDPVTYGLYSTPGYKVLDISSGVTINGNKAGEPAYLAAGASAITLYTNLVLDASARFVMPNLPTSTNGFIVAGTMWNSNGVLCVWNNP